MKKILTLICTLLCANVLLSQTYDGAVYVEDVIYAYNNSDQTAVVYGYRYENPPTDLVIPSTIAYQGTTYSVTSIGEDAFRRTYYGGGWREYPCESLTSVTIGNSVTSIGNNAFFYCSSLTSVTIGNSVTSIGNNAFLYCNSLTSVTIPNSVTSIGNSAFYDCSSLTSVTIGNSVTSIGGGAFYDCSSLTSVTIPNSVTSIGGSAFEYCSSLTSVTIGNSVTSIGDWAFSHCFNLTSITIPNSVTSIGDLAFFDCSSLTSVTIGNSVTSIGERAFSDCSSLTSITIPNSVTSIGEAVFYNCSSLTSVTLSNNITELPHYYEYGYYYGFFENCNSLTSITIPNSVTSIGRNAFSYCSSLTSVTIGNSVTSIGRNAFSDCSSLTSVTIPNSVTSIGQEAFASCSSLTSVTIPNSVSSIELGTFDSCINLTSVTIGNSVTSIGGSAFENCNSLTSITIPNSVTSIGTSAFSGCSSLTSVTCLRSNSPSLGSGVFYGTPNNKTLTIPCGYESEYTDWQNATTWASIDCIVIIGSRFTIGDLTYEVTSETELKVQDCTESATSVVIPETVTYQGTTYSVTSIGNGAFFECSNLTSVTIPNSVTYIGDAAFGWCSSLTSVTIGNSVISIASGAFNNCHFLQNVTCLANTPPTLADNTVFPYPNIASLTVPCGTLEAYSAPTSFWNMFFIGRISENGYNVEATANDNAFGSVAVESDCSTATLTATANEGYQFVSWNDGNTDNPRTVALTSDTSFTAIFALIDNSSLSEDAEFAELSVYPNPTRGKVSFNQAIEKVEVIDLSGKTLQTYENANEINIETLPAGVYHLRMTIGDKTTTRKVIKE